MKIKDYHLSLYKLANDVLLKYNILPEKMKIIQDNGLKTLWKFGYNNQTMCLKRLKHSKDKALFTVNAQIYIYKNGGNVPRIYLNTKGEAITEFNEQLFVLYEWIDGRDLNFSNPSDLRLAMEGISRFHLYSKGYKPPKGARVSSKLGRWSNQYQSMKSRMLKWKEQSLLKPHNPSFKCYLKYISSIIGIADMALNELEKSSYNKLTDIKFEESSLCHQDYGEGNVIYSDGIVYVIDLDGVTYDLPMRDLRKIIGKRMIKHGKWEKETILTILKWYERNNKLSYQEKELMKIDLLFPHWFFGDVKNIYKKKSK